MPALKHTAQWSTVMMSFVAKHWQECIWMLIGLSHGGAEYLALAALQLPQSVTSVSATETVWLIIIAQKVILGNIEVGKRLSSLQLLAISLVLFHMQYATLIL
jgi:hypothetical protein